MENILDVKNLSVLLDTREKQSLLVDNVSFSLRPGECLGILGESGSGKSLTVNQSLVYWITALKFQAKPFIKTRIYCRNLKKTCAKYAGAALPWFCRTR